MSVFAPGTPNLAPEYGNIISQLQNGANLALNRPGLNTAVAPVAEAVNKKFDELDRAKQDIAKIYLGHKLNVELQKNQQDFEKRGDVIIDQDHIDQMKHAFGVDLSPWKGTVVPEGASKLPKLISEAKEEFDSKAIQDIWNNPKLSPAQKKASVEKYLIGSGAKGVATEAAKAEFGQQKVDAKPYADPSSSTGYRWGQPDAAGLLTKRATDLEAPVPSGAATKTKPIPASELDRSTSLNALSGKFQAAIDNYDPGLVGMGNARLGRASQLIKGLATDQKAKFYSAVQGLQNDALNKDYGKRLTSVEINRYAGPKDTSSDQDFRSRLVEAAKAINEDLATRDASFKASGYTGTVAPKMINIPDGFEAAQYTPNSLPATAPPALPPTPIAAGPGVSVAPPTPTGLPTLSPAGSAYLQKKTAGSR